MFYCWFIFISLSTKLCPHVKICTNIIQHWTVWCFSNLVHWRMFNGNNIVITIIHWLSDSDNLLFYYYCFILITILLYQIHVIVTSGRMYMRLWLKIKRYRYQSGARLLGRPTTLVPVCCMRVYMNIQSGRKMIGNISPNCSQFIIT